MVERHGRAPTTHLKGERESGCAQPGCRMCACVCLLRERRIAVVCCDERAWKAQKFVTHMMHERQRVPTQRAKERGGGPERATGYCGGEGKTWKVGRIQRQKKERRPRMRNER